LQLRIAANIVDRAATLCLPQNKTGVLSASLGLQGFVERRRTMGGGSRD
jgi:hypothetical protein